MCVFTVKYVNRRFHMKLHPGYERYIFHILISEDITDVIPLFSFVFRQFFLFLKHLYLCNKKKITRWLEHKFIFSWKKD